MFLVYLLLFTLFTLAIGNTDPSLSIKASFSTLWGAFG